VKCISILIVTTANRSLCGGEVFYYGGKKKHNNSSIHDHADVYLSVDILTKIK
jgi:hypothetical protein